MTSTEVEHVVLDVSAMVDLLAGLDGAEGVRARVVNAVLHAPAHFDAEVLSAFGRLCRSGELAVTDVDAALAALQRVPLSRHPLPALLAGAWSRRTELRLVDALYAELAEQLDARLVTTDARLARVCSRAEVPAAI